jgi:hypothetical protein
MRPGGFPVLTTQAMQVVRGAACGGMRQSVA